MKKHFIAGFAIATTLALSLGISACSDLSGMFGKDETFDRPTTAAQAYSFSAASAGTIISAMNDNGAAAYATATAEAPLAQPLSFNVFANNTAVTDEETINSLNDYMMLVESLLSDGSFGTDYQDSDRAEYAVKAVVSYTAITGESFGYTMYYNESNKVTKTDRDFDDWFEDEEIETRANIDGVLVIDGIDYPFSGKTESESEGDESEIKTTFSVALAEGKVMRVEQESESEWDEREEEYCYTLYENGIATERSTFKLEQERDETEIEFTLKKGAESQIFYFEQNLDKRNSIKITVGSKNSRQVYFVQIVTDENGNTSYIYETPNGERYQHGRFHD